MVNTQLAHSSQLVVNGLLTAASAAHFVKLSPEGAVRVAKLRTLSVLALVNILGQGWGWMDGRTVFARAAVVLGSVVLNLLGSIFIYWETHSRAMLHFLRATPGIAIVHAVLAMAFPLDLKGRLIHSPESDFNDLNLHWSLSLRAFINAGSMLAARITDSHAISISEPRSRRASCVVPLAADCSGTDPWASLWGGLSALLVGLAASFLPPSGNRLVGPVGRQQVRELLSMDTAQDNGLASWLPQFLSFGGWAGLWILMSMAMVVLYSRSPDQGLPPNPLQNSHGGADSL